MIAVDDNHTDHSSDIEDDRLRDWFCREGATKHQEIQTDLLQYQGDEGLSTGDWLFESEDFKDWLRYPQQFLLLHGRGKYNCEAK